MVKNTISKTLIVLSILIIGIITICNLFFTAKIDKSEIVHLGFSEPIMIVATFILTTVILFIAIITNKYHFTKKTKIVLIIIGTIIYLIFNIMWIQLSKVEPVADQKEVNDIAILIVNNETEKLKENNYLELNPQQIGTSCVIALIYKIFNSTNFHVIQYVNLICNVISIFVIYSVIKQFLKEYKWNDGIYFLLSFTCVPLILLTTFVYGDYIGLAFSILGIYNIMKYIDTKKFIYLITTIIFMAISYIVKSNYLIFIVAIILYLILDFLSKKDWKKLLVIIVFACACILPNQILQNIVRNNLEFKKDNAVPFSAYIYMGMSESYRASGWYNYDIMNTKMDYPVKIKERIIEFSKNPIYTIKFYTKKTISMWSESTFGSFWYNLPFQIQAQEEYEATMNKNKLFNSICVGNLNKIITIYEKALAMIVFFSTFWAICKNRKNISLNFLLFIIIILGGFLFHTIWEAKSRYILPYVILIIPISVIGIQEIVILYNKIRNKLKGESDDI